MEGQIASGENFTINCDPDKKLIFQIEKINQPFKIHKMETIVLKPLYHQDQECIGIYFERKLL